MKTDHPVVSAITIDAAKVKKIWIHCNCCFEHYVNEKAVFFLLACQHVICEKCVTASLGRIPGDAPTYVCPICQKMVRGRQINNALPSNLKGMFHPAPWHDGLPHDLIDSFQRANCKNLEKFILKKVRILNTSIINNNLNYLLRKKKNRSWIKTYYWPVEYVKNNTWNSIDFVGCVESSSVVCDI